MERILVATAKFAIFKRFGGNFNRFFKGDYCPWIDWIRDLRQLFVWQAAKVMAAKITNILRMFSPACKN